MEEQLNTLSSVAESWGSPAVSSGVLKVHSTVMPGLDTGDPREAIVECVLAVSRAVYALDTSSDSDVQQFHAEQRLALSALMQLHCRYV